MSASYDSPWKDVLETHLPAVLALLFPDVHAGIDWSHDYDSLEAELRKLSAEGQVGNRIADKLIRVRTLGGDDNYLHVEVQGQPEGGFERRVHV